MLTEYVIFDKNSNICLEGYYPDFPTGVERMTELEISGKIVYYHERKFTIINNELIQTVYFKGNVDYFK